jgi:hypothetical protein
LQGLNGPPLGNENRGPQRSALFGMAVAIGLNVAKFRIGKIQTIGLATMRFKGLFRQTLVK